MTVKRFCKNLIYSKNSVFKTGFRKSLRVLLFSLKTVLIRIDFIDTLSFEVFQTSFGRLTQLKEQRIFNPFVKSLSLLPPTISGAVVQLVRTLACHARGRGFESHLFRHTEIHRQLSKARKSLFRLLIYLKRFSVSLHLRFRGS